MTPRQSSSRHKAPTGNNGGIRLRKVNYEAFAKRAGKNAHRIAMKNGLGPELAKEYEKIWGAPVKPENRLS